MANEATFRQNTGQQDSTPAAATLAGVISQLGDGRAAVLKADTAASELGAVYTEGIFDIACATGTLWTAGDPVYWDNSGSLAVVSPGASDDFFLGSAVATKASGPLVVRVDLNKGGAIQNRGVWISAPIAMVHDDATEINIIEANENPNGLIVKAFFGLVTEAPAGSSEDQMIMDLRDEDDNVLSQITTTNTTPDAAGDVVQGTLSVEQGAQGVVMAVIPATKAAYVVVSQATAGTPAGEVDVYVEVAPLL